MTLEISDFFAYHASIWLRKSTRSLANEGQNRVLVHFLQALRARKKT